MLGGEGNDSATTFSSGLPLDYHEDRYPGFFDYRYHYFDGEHDVIDGGLGHDYIDLSMSGAIYLNQDGLPNDGARGEGDNITGFERVRGTIRADTIHGTGADDEIDGNGGRDLILGHGGNDKLESRDRAGRWRARLYGGAGNDLIDTTSAALVDAGEGDDLLVASDLAAFKQVAFANPGGYDLLHLTDEPAGRAYSADDGRGLGAIEPDDGHATLFAEGRGIDYTPLVQEPWWSVR